MEDSIFEVSCAVQWGKWMTGTADTKDVVKQLGERGLVSVTDDMNMENYQKVEGF